jgi:hypothetical protein
MWVLVTLRSNNNDNKKIAYKLTKWAEFTGVGQISISWVRKQFKTYCHLFLSLQLLPSLVCPLPKSSLSSPRTCIFCYFVCTCSAGAQTESLAHTKRTRYY